MTRAEPESTLTPSGSTGYGRQAASHRQRLPLTVIDYRGLPCFH